MATKLALRGKAAQVVRELKSIGDARIADGQRRFFKEPIRPLGVSAPQLRGLEKKLFGGVDQAWSVDEALKFCERVLTRRLLEPTLLAILVLRRFQARLGPDAFGRAESWLARNLCDNWAAVDTLCPVVIAPILRKHRRLILRVKGWAASPNRWLRRASAVAFVTLAGQRSFHPAIYSIAARLIGDHDDDLVQKANGWMLREAARADPERLEAFLLRHGPAVPRTTVRYALERFPAARRKRLMSATRE